MQNNQFCILSFQDYSWYVHFHGYHEYYKITKLKIKRIFFIIIILTDYSKGPTNLCLHENTFSLKSPKLDIHRFICIHSHLLSLAVYDILTLDKIWHFIHTIYHESAWFPTSLYFNVIMKRKFQH